MLYFLPIQINFIVQFHHMLLQSLYLLIEYFPVCN